MWGLLLSAWVALAACSPGADPGTEAAGPGRGAGGRPPSGWMSRGPSQRAAASEVLVRFRDGTGEDAMERVRREIGLEVIRTVSGPNLLLMKVAPGASVEEALQRLQQRPEVEYAEPNFVRSLKEN